MGFLNFFEKSLKGVEPAIKMPQELKKTLGENAGETSYETPSIKFSEEEQEEMKEEGMTSADIEALQKRATGRILHKGNDTVH